VTAPAVNGATTPRLDPGRLHVLTDETLQQRFSHAELAGLAAAGGADVVQLREKRERSFDWLVAAAREARARTAAHGARLVVDDRPDVAHAAAADGVHLGPGDPEPATARRMLGAGRLIGATANDLARARVAASWPVDYLGVGPLRSSRTKGVALAPLGLPGLARIAEAVELPIIAIGGLTERDVDAVLDHGAHGIAVLAAVVRADDPLAATARLREAIERWLARRGRRG
jgi:thiamine-phosphate pyrophosphorylase